ncbi:hypothetical protein BDF21DRAFT_422795 [Thamnidium elegans]|nr:hypothetical protein BDF21DRAFT_422795 [Thamnidium elegans]
MVMSQQCEDYRAFSLRNRISREPFPATEQNMLAYIRYRGRNSTCFNYFINLDRHPSHGNEWLNKMNSSEKIRNEIKRLICLYDIPISKYPSVIGIPGNKNGKLAANKLSPISGIKPVEGNRSVMRGFMVSNPASEPVSNHIAVPISVFEPEKVSVPKTIFKSKNTLVTKSVSEPKSISKPNKIPNKLPSEASSKTPSKTRSKASSKELGEALSNILMQNKVSKSTSASGSNYASKPPKKVESKPPVPESFTKRRPYKSLLNEKVKKRDITSEYMEPYILIESLGPAQRMCNNNSYALVEQEDSSEDYLDDLEIGYGSRRLVLYESEEEIENKKKGKWKGKGKEQEYEIKQYDEREDIKEKYVKDQYENEEYEGGYEEEYERDYEVEYERDYEEEYERDYEEQTSMEQVSENQVYENQVYDEEKNEEEEEYEEEEEHEEEVQGSYDFNIEAYNNYIEEKKKEDKLEKDTGIRVNEGTLYIFSHISIEKSFR